MTTGVVGLLAVNERVVFGNPMAVGGGQPGEVTVPSLAHRPQCFWAGRGRNSTSPDRVFRLIHRVQRFALREWQEPSLDQPKSPRQFPKRIAPLLHHPFCRIHLGFKFRVIGGDAEAVRRFGDKNGIAASDFEFGKRFLRQNDAEGIAEIRVILSFMARLRCYNKYYNVQDAVLSSKEMARFELRGQHSQAVSSRTGQNREVLPGNSNGAPCPAIFAKFFAGVNSGSRAFGAKRFPTSRRSTGVAQTEWSQTN